MTKTWLGFVINWNEGYIFKTPDKLKLLLKSQRANLYKNV